MRHALFALTILAASPGPAFATQTLTFTALGEVSVGMTVAQAEAALGTTLTVETMDDEPGACGHARRDDEPGIGYMLGGGAINRIDVDGADPSLAPPDVRTEAGIGVGATEEQIKQAYAAAAVESPHPYTEGPDSHYYKVTAPDGEHAIVFETYNGKVTTFRAGLSQAVDFIEGCL